MLKVKINCPICSKVGLIDVFEDTIKNNARGLIAISVIENIICSHSFIVYIDRNLVVRDYFISDFQIKVPEIALSEEIGKSFVPSKEIINLDLIKLNISAALLAFVLNSIFFKKKIVIISENLFLKNHILNFFKYITKNTFNYEISIITKEDYKSNKTKYRDFVVFEGHIEKDKIIDSKLKLEKQISYNFFVEPDLSYSYIILKNEIRKIYLLSKSIADFIRIYKKRNNLNSKVIIDYLFKEYGVKVHFTYLNFLINIVKDYFELIVPELHEFVDFLGLI